jgi:nucleoside-diphosphate-sugar epimerase
MKKNLGGETFNLGGETITVNQIAKMVLEEFEKSTGNKPDTVNTPPRLGETKEFSYNLSKTRSMLGLKNQWTVREGIRQIIRYCLEL